MNLFTIMKKVERIKEIQERRIKEGNTGSKVEEVHCLNVAEAEYLIRIIKERIK